MTELRIRAIQAELGDIRRLRNRLGPLQKFARRELLARHRKLELLLEKRREKTVDADGAAVAQRESALAMSTIIHSK